MSVELMAIVFVVVAMLLVFAIHDKMITRLEKRIIILESNKPRVQKVSNDG